MPSALVILAEGAEEMETVISVDVLRRGEVSPHIILQLWKNKVKLGSREDMGVKKSDIIFTFKKFLKL